MTLSVPALMSGPIRGPGRNRGNQSILRVRRSGGAEAAERNRREGAVHPQSVVHVFLGASAAARPAKRRLWARPRRRSGRVSLMSTPRVTTPGGQTMSGDGHGAPRKQRVDWCDHEGRRGPSLRRFNSVGLLTACGESRSSHTAATTTTRRADASYPTRGVHVINLNLSTTPDGTPYRDLNRNGITDPFDDPRKTPEEGTDASLSTGPQS